MRYKSQTQEWIAETCNGDYAFKDYKDALAYEKRPCMKVLNARRAPEDGRIFWTAEYQGYTLQMVDEEIDDHDNFDGWINIDALHEVIVRTFNDVVYDMVEEDENADEDCRYSFGDDRYEESKYG